MEKLSQNLLQNNASWISYTIELLDQSQYISYVPYSLKFTEEWDSCTKNMIACLLNHWHGFVLENET